MTMYRDLNDQALYELIQKGNHLAYREVYFRYHQPIYLYILKFVKSPGITEDLVHDVFLKLWEIRERIQIHTSFEAYLYRISRNMTYRKLGSIIADRELRTEVMQHVAFTPACDDPLKEKQYRQLLHEAMDRLPPQRQRIFRLCREEGYTYAQVSEQLGISRNTIKEHMSESMRFIKLYFMEKGDIVLALMLLSSRHF